MAVLDFPAAPTAGQVATLTNGFSYQWDGAVWTLTPASPGQVAGGDLTGTYPNPTIAPAAVTWPKTSLRTYARVGRTATISIPNNALTVIGGFDVVETNVGGLFSLGAPDRFTIIDAGFYMFGGQIGYEPAGVGVRRIQLNVNGSFTNMLEHPAGRWNGAAWTSDYARLAIHTGRFLNPSDYIQLVAYQDAGGALNANVSVQSVMWISRVS
jgi:hypothetical protein